MEALKGTSVLISGAGIAGPAMAYWLHRLGARPTLIEHAPRFRDGGYMVDVWGVGYDLLERMGLLDAARDRGYLFERLAFVDESGRNLAGLDVAVFRRAFGGRFFSIPRGDLARVVFDAVKADVEILYGTSVEAIRQDDSSAEVVLTGGRSRRFDLVVGADGLGSRVRECAFGRREEFERHLGYWVAAFVADGYPHRDEDVFVTFARPGRQISRYALRGGESAFLLSFAEGQSLEVSPHDPDQQKRILRERFGTDGWECREILDALDGADLYFDAVSQIRTGTWSKGRVVLVGDAAYCPSLLAGAGAAYAMLGAFVLADELQHFPRDLPAAFAAYERRLRPFIERQQRKAMRFASSFMPRSALGLSLRNTIVNLMRHETLGRCYARHAFSSSFELSTHGDLG